MGKDVFLPSEKNDIRAYKRSVIFIMQRALTRIDKTLLPRLRVMYSMGTGYYCKFEGGMEINDEFIGKLDKTMREIVEENIEIKKIEIPTIEAREMFEKKGLLNKEKLLRYQTDSSIDIYELDGEKDYFYENMLPKTFGLKYFKIEKYDEGLVIVFPEFKGSTKVEKFNPQHRLYSVLKESTDWSLRMGISSVGELNDAIANGKTRDIVLMQEAFMEEKIGSLAKQIAQRSDCRFVMIAGPSSSGKTTFSHRLSLQLRAQGLNPYPLPLDDYYLGRDMIPLDEEGKKDYESMYALDIERFNSDMSDLLEGREAQIPIYNFKTGKREEAFRTMKLADGDILVIEGIHGLNDEFSKSLPKESKFKIYISALGMLAIDEHNPLSTSDGRLFRRIVRDARTRATSAKETIAMWPSVRRGEQNNIFPFQEQADAMFNSALIYELAVMKIYAMPQLYSIDPEDEEYAESLRLRKILDYVLPMPTEDIANNSLIREFIGGSVFNA